jgi:putative ABC transport system permease protein
MKAEPASPGAARMMQAGAPQGQAYARRRDPRRILAVAGIGFCAALFGALWSIYRGAVEGSVAYFRDVDADVWVLQRSADNLIRGLSILPAGRGGRFAVDGVESVSRILVLPASVQAAAGVATVTLVGFEPQRPGGPPALAGGRDPARDDEIAIDEALARKLKVRPGDAVSVAGHPLTVTGLSARTNATAMQYAFVTLGRAQDLLPVPGLVSAYLLKAAPGADPAAVAAAAAARDPAIVALGRETLVAANARVLDESFLPVLVLVTGLSAILLLVILSLIVSMSVLEHRRTFAIFKILGASRTTIWAAVERDALGLALAGLVAAAAIAAAIVPLLRLALPTANLYFAPAQALLEATAVIAIAAVSGSLATLQTRGIYPLEAFEWRQ